MQGVYYSPVGTRPQPAGTVKNSSSPVPADQISADQIFNDRISDDQRLNARDVEAPISVAFLTLLANRHYSSDSPVACALISKNDAPRMCRFMRNLKKYGFSPETVILDRSPLCPKLIAQLWLETKHQLCVLYVISEVNDRVLDAAGEVRQANRPKRVMKGRGRPSKRNRARVKKLKDQREQRTVCFGDGISS